jgi:hypothetical protein
MILSVQGVLGLLFLFLKVNSHVAKMSAPNFRRSHIGGRICFNLARRD